MQASSGMWIERLYVLQFALRQLMKYLQLFQLVLRQ